MPVKIRLMRIGAKKRPFYRVVAIDERNKRNGAYLELLGTYNPLTEPKEINLKQDRIDDWVKKGAQPSHGFLRILGKAPQRPPRKSKKAKDEPAAPAHAPASKSPADDAAEPTTEAAESAVNETPQPEPTPEAVTGKTDPASSEETNSAEPEPSEESKPEATSSEEEKES